MIVVPNSKKKETSQALGMYFIFPYFYSKIPEITETTKKQKTKYGDFVPTRIRSSSQSTVTIFALFTHIKQTNTQSCSICKSSEKQIQSQVAI